MEKDMGFEMRYFTDEQIDRLVQQRVKVLRLAQIATVRQAPAVLLKEKTESLVATRISRLKFCPQVVQVTCGVRRDGGGTQLDRDARLERFEPHLKRKHLLEKIGRAQGLLKRRDGVFRQMND